MAVGFAQSMRLVEGIGGGSSAHHVQIHRQCGACHHAFQINERMVSLMRVDGKIKACDAKSVTPDTKCEQNRDAAVEFCKRRGCPECLVSGETATIHADCFHLFMKTCTCSTKDKLFKLWVASVAMSPWRRQAPLLLPFEPLCPARIRQIVESWRIPQIQQLPQELQDIIVSLTQGHMTWRYGVVLEQAHRLSQMKLEVPTILWALGDVIHWTRETKPIFDTEYDQNDDSMYTRIVIDSCGIKEIARIHLAGKDSMSNVLSRHQLFVFEQLSKVKKVHARFMSGRCRLIVPESDNLVLWNASMPLHFGDSLPMLQTHSYNRFTAVDTSSSFGLTFFCGMGHIVAVHAHTNQEPDAVQTWRNIYPLIQEYVEWIYVPLPEADEILGFGTRTFSDRWSSNLRPFCLLLKLKLQGVIAIGFRAMDGRVRDTIYRTSGRPFLLYNTRDMATTRLLDRNTTTTETAGVRVAAPFPRQDDIETNIQRLHRVSNFPSTEGLFFSSAPLEDLIAADTFSDPARRYCRGILLHYADGAQRSLGQCRLGVDHVVRVKNPVQMCWWPTLYTDELRRSSFKHLSVKFRDKPIKPHGEMWNEMLLIPEHRCYDMKGTLQCCSAFRYMELSVVD
ncbi:hypothetical protein NLG97_g7898 [Lecanicillium saksenae]|uniref:Uncharacterized protein n=1 Tax=Lecanicillium saksenae TaxID=468837 RepID=A0ACC1QNQ7_9HYPO|nr:hypothetical protein NLG97_g7898 [Lecanicillium saksenae]